MRLHIVFARVPPRRLASIADQDHAPVDAADAYSIVFLSDFGLSNEWVGISHAVMNQIAPQGPIVDLSHLVPPLDVLSGALLLADSMPYIAEEAVVLASELASPETRRTAGKGTPGDR